MSLSPGVRLGAYEVVSLIGAGGMGEVYRARDPRLGRDVAIKVLPAGVSTDPDRLRRFEQEARAAAALNHPGILAIYDSGTHEGAPYFVSELLEGATLRERLADGPLSPRRILEIAAQLTSGLAAAHEKGLVHRDLKPENIFITGDGRVRILDFGLAKLTQRELVPAGTAVTGAINTSQGVVLGTVGYMAPEQVRGWTVDHRADIFAFGVILYEMVAGARAFERDSAVETLNAILKEDPPELPPTAPAPLERVIRRCVEKNPNDRFQSAKDLGFALETLSVVTGASRSAATLPTVVSRSRWRPVLLGAAAAAVAAIAAVAVLLWSRVPASEQPVFQRLTYRRGTLFNARFAPDGQTVVYSAGWDDAPFRLFQTRSGSTESRDLGLPEADILSVSSKGELAILLGRARGPFNLGTLARVPLDGGAPREVLENVRAADWAPQGDGLAISRFAAGKSTIEFPIGKVLFQSAGAIFALALSPDGQRIAFFERSDAEVADLAVRVLDPDRSVRTLSSGWRDLAGLAWSPRGDKIWFSAAAESPPAVHVVTLAGELRVVGRMPGALVLQDVAPDGRVLVSTVNWRGGIVMQPPGGQPERELSWLDWSVPVHLSADGTTLLFNEGREGGGVAGSIYIRKTDGSPAVRLGEGTAWALSPDGNWVLTTDRRRPGVVILLPTKAGEPRALSCGNVRCGGGTFFPDGRRLMVWGFEPGRRGRNWILDVGGGVPRPVTPEGTDGGAVSADGKFIANRGADFRVVIYPVDGGAPRELAPETRRHFPVQWTAKGDALFLRSWREPALFRYDLATNRMELWKKIVPSDRGGLIGIQPIKMTPDGTSYVYGYNRHLNDLYVATGLR